MITQGSSTEGRKDGRGGYLDTGVDGARAWSFCFLVRGMELLDVGKVMHTEAVLLSMCNNLLLLRYLGH